MLVASVESMDRNEWLRGKNVSYFNLEDSEDDECDMRSQIKNFSELDNMLEHSLTLSVCQRFWRT